jgi:cytochrome P450
VTWTFPLRRSDPACPPPDYVSELSRPPSRVALAYGGEAWLITSFADARQVLADAHFSSDSTRPGYPSFPLATRERVPGHFLSMDAPEHTRLRRVVASGFSASSLRGIRPFITALASRLVTEAVPARTFDLVSQVAVPMHGGVIAELLGVPAVDQPLFQACTRQLQRHDASAASRLAATTKLSRYLTNVLDRGDSGSQDTMIGVLARSRDAGSITQAEAVAAASLVLVAGLETTVGLAALTVLALLRERLQWDLVVGRSERWADAAVNEALRYWSPVQHGVARVATSDVEVRGHVIRAGDAVVVHLPTANRDPQVHADPDRFDITRDERGHLAFGHGPHHCLGAALAHAEVSAILTALARQAPALALAQSEDDLCYLDNMLVYGLQELYLSVQSHSSEEPTQ